MIRVVSFKELAYRPVDGEVEINKLLAQVSANAPHLALETFLKFLGQNNVHLVVALDGDSIAGMGTIILNRSLMGMHGKIEDVVVDNDYRGQGLGRRITEKLIRIAKGAHAEWIDLTSNPSRIAALALYNKLGFRRIDTNCLRLIL